MTDLVYSALTGDVTKPDTLSIDEAKTYFRLVTLGITKR